jgi:hypothetical protein
MPSTRRLATVLSAAALACLALAAAGCGGTGPNGSAVADIGTTGTTATTTGASQGTPTTAAEKVQAAYAFSKCMRANGVPTFPDPQTSAGGTRLTIGANSNIDPNSPSFQAAQKKCRKLLPNGGRPTQAQIQKAEQQALAYSKCMRAHGVPSFPDPQFDTSGGGFGIRIGVRAGSGLDPNSPAFQKAQQTCGNLLPGATQKTGVGPSSGSGGSSGGTP